MAPKRYLVILNPIAGKGKAAERIPEVEAFFTSRKLEYELRLTKGVWHAAELAREAAREGFAAVVAAGGDGTVNEVVNGLMLSHNRGDEIPEMGVLAVGRGNDFAYGADIPEGLEACVEAIVKGESRPMDVGLVVGGDYPQGRYFANGLGAGFDTIVGLAAAKMKVHGFMAYVFGAVKTFVEYPPAPEVRVTFDGSEIACRSHQVSIMNGKRLGGAFFYAPWAENHDGLLDVMVTEELTRRQMVSFILSISKGEHGRRTDVRFGRGSRIGIEAPGGGLVVHADGETICVNGSSLQVECLPSRVRMICAPGLHPAAARP
jgi:YegS/Rv2252/BmrU family lipid kinase